MLQNKNAKGVIEMSNINADLARMESDAGRLSALSATLSDVRQSLRNTKRSILLGSSSASLRFVCQGLDTCASRLERQVAKNNSLSSSLYDIIEVYREKELSAIDLGGALREISEAVAGGNTSGAPSASGGAANGTAVDDTQEGSVDLEDMSYEEALEYRRQHAVDENSRLLYERYLNRIRINDDDYDGTAHYNNILNHINYNAEDDSRNRRGIGNTYYHEVGHLIDDRSDIFGLTSNDSRYNFYVSLQNDLDNYFGRIMTENGYTDISDAYAELSEWLNSDPHMMNGISDIVRGLTNGQATGPWGHSMSYYNRDSIEAEAFAHFFEASMRCDSVKLDYIKEIFPEAYETYQRMIRDELN